MVELERSLLKMLSSSMTSWKRYVDETNAYVKIDAIKHVLRILNSFILTNSNSFGTTLHRNSTHYNINLD